MNCGEFVPGAGIEPALTFSANRILSPACLPIPPPGRRKKIHPWIRMDMLSGRRDSNPRPSPWQGDALPAELLPHLYKNLKRSAKITNTWDWQKKITCIWEYSSCFQALLLLVFLYNAWNTAHNSRPKEMQ